MPPDALDDDKNDGAMLRSRCTNALKERAAAFCKNRGMSEGTLVRLAVIEFLDRQQQGPGSATLLLNQSTALSPVTPAQLVRRSVSYGASKANRKRKRKPRPSPPALDSTADRKAPAAS